MNDELNDLYQQVILDHNKSPRNWGIIDHPNHKAEGYNPLCGDRLDLFIIVENDIIKDIKFNGNGCAISKASASIMTTLLIGKTVENALKLFDIFHEVVTSDTDSEIDEEKLGKLAVFAGVRQFPARIKCASLSWHTLLAALNKEEVVTTE
jgi:nitrogen fixation protein NifU and related proteins